LETMDAKNPISRADPIDSDGITIGKTSGGIMLDQLVDWSNMTIEQSRIASTPYSKFFAEQASGPINAWAGGASIDSVFMQTELPTLINNPQVNKIIILDAVNTSKIKIIYPIRP
jgi:hypothetical protein